MFEENKVPVDIANTIKSIPVLNMKHYGIPHQDKGLQGSTQIQGSTLDLHFLN